MTDAIAHRGPDGSGAWRDEQSGLVLGHRRLSIVDLSERGTQPMQSRCGRYVITFNGEIYNFLELRAALVADGAAFESQGDTEVLVAAISHWGLDEALRRSVGMFAFAVFDRREGVLCLARDRLGKKPLYFSVGTGRFLFASELRALRAFPNLDCEVCPTAISEFLQFGYICAPNTIYASVKKLRAGEVAEIRLLAPDGVPLVRRRLYWSPHGAGSGSDDLDRVPMAQAVREIDELIGKAVACRMIADVPLGAFLSGGIDSSLVVARMQSIAGAPVRTFSIGFDDQRFDESADAERVARYLGTEHVTHVITEATALDAARNVVRHLDEPIADPSVLPTQILCALTRSAVTVALSGDGGDECFGGYSRYRWFDRLALSRRVLTGVGRGVAASSMYAMADLATAVVHQGQRIPASVARRASQARRVAAVLAARDDYQAYQELCRFLDDGNLTKRSNGRPFAWREPSFSARGAEAISIARSCDFESYLPENLMVKLDRASMSVGLEVRSPLLDHRIVEMLNRRPYLVSRRGTDLKWVLKELLFARVPRELVDRPKMGFGIPLDAWLSGPLRDWAQALLEQDLPTAAEKTLNQAELNKTWNEHLSGKRRNPFGVWTMLVLVAWLRGNE